MKIEGRNAVGEAIRAGKTIDRLLVQKGLKDSAANKLIDEAKSRGIKIFFREKEALDRESAQGRHQGFLAEITDFVYCELTDILAIAQKRHEPPFVLVLDGVYILLKFGFVLKYVVFFYL